jgi:hypothetical protein
MGKIIAIGPGGKPQAPGRSDYFRDAIDWCQRNGLLDKLVLTPPCRDYDHADWTRRMLLLSARYYCSCGRFACTRRHSNWPGPDGKPGGCPLGGQRLTGRADVVKDGDGKLRVQFQLHDKRESLRSFIKKYGTDRAKWPYDPRAKRAEKM